MKRRRVKALSLVLAAMLPFTVTGVSAAWHYSLGDIDGASAGVGIRMDLFNIEKGLNYQMLLEALLSDEKGLNNTDSLGIFPTANNLLRWSIKNRSAYFDTVGTMSVISGWGFQNSFIKDEWKELCFVIQFNRDSKGNITSYNIFILEKKYLVNESGNYRLTNGEEYPGGRKEGAFVYPVIKTEVTKDPGSGKWVETKTETGSVRLAEYDTFTDEHLACIAPGSWTLGNKMV